MPNITFQQVYNLIHAALTGRTAGTKVQVADHEAAEMALLQYASQQSPTEGSAIRTGHVQATGGQNNYLAWNIPFDDLNYAFAVNGFDSSGNPLMIKLIEQSANRLTLYVPDSGMITGLAYPYITND